jgi:glutathione S-transferase
MVLVGMPDSPYVRRCAISMKMMGIPFEHQQVSVFRHMDRFRSINPVIKAPTFVCDDGTVLMDSTLILDYLEHCVAPDRALTPARGLERARALRSIGLAMAACEKNVQLVYEKEQRPPDKRHGPWVDRVTAQAHAAFAELEREAEAAKPWLQGGRLDSGDIAVAVAWRFGQFYNAQEVPASRYPALVAYSERAEALAEFASTPLE